MGQTLLAVLVGHVVLGCLVERPCLGVLECRPLLGLLGFPVGLVVRVVPAGMACMAAGSLARTAQSAACRGFLAFLALLACRAFLAFRVLPEDLADQAGSSRRTKGSGLG